MAPSKGGFIGLLLIFLLQGTLPKHFSPRKCLPWVAGLFCLDIFWASSDFTVRSKMRICVLSWSPWKLSTKNRSMWRRSGTTRVEWSRFLSLVSTYYMQLGYPVWYILCPLNALLQFIVTSSVHIVDSILHIRRYKLELSE